MPPVPLKPVPRYDHFAPLVGTSIGARNLLLFTLQLVLWAFNAGLVLFLSLMELWAAEEATLEGAAWVLLVLAAAGQAVFVWEEAVLHAWLVSSNLTRHEYRHRRRLVYMRQAGGSYPRLPESQGVPLPFTRRSLLLNAAESLGIPGGGNLYGSPPQGRWHDWLQHPVWTAVELVDHPLRRATLDKLAELVLAAERAGTALEPQQRLAVRLAERTGALQPVLQRRRERKGDGGGKGEAGEDRQQQQHDKERSKGGTHVPKTGSGSSAGAVAGASAPKEDSS